MALSLKMDGDIRVISGLYGDNGKENGNYNNGLYRAKGLGSKGTQERTFWGI